MLRSIKGKDIKGDDIGGVRTQSRRRHGLLPSRPHVAFALFLCLALALLFTSCSSPLSTTTAATPTTSSSSSASPSPTTSSPSGATPTTASQSPSGAKSAISAAQGFYQLVKVQDYTKAYDSYIDPNATLTVNGITQKFTRDAFVAAAKAADSIEGKVTDYSALADTTDPSKIIMTASRVNNPRYHSHLQFKQEGGTWKIVALDTI